MAFRILFILILATATVAQAAPLVTSSEVRALLRSQKASEARKLIQNAPNSAEFLKTAEGQALYAGALCYSPPAELSTSDVEHALQYVAAAQRALRDTNLGTWAENAANQCKTRRQQLARAQRDIRLTEFSGKIAGACGPNPSGIFLPHPIGRSLLLSSLLWVPFTPDIDDSSPSAPPDELLTKVMTDHKAPSPAVAICPPFIAVSSDQDPKGLCAPIQRFYDYFHEHYRTTPPAAWLVIHHYATDEQMAAHVEKHRGPRCSGTYGYYDWYRQTIAYKSKKGYFGTLQHELTHAMIFWDIPLAPRWFEEGLAALYENTDSSYHGLPNPWREKIFKNLRNPEITLDYFNKILKMDDFEFERTPEPATISRALMMKLQGCGDLDRLYHNIREYTLGLSTEEKRSLERPAEQIVARYQEMLTQCDCRGNENVRSKGR